MRAGVTAKVLIGREPHGWLVRVCLLLLLAALSSNPATANDEFALERSFYRTTIQGRPVRLEGLLVKRTDLPGRLPVALITHGRTSSVTDALDLRATDFAAPARDLARRGYLAAVVMRRGYGQSDGPASNSNSCDPAGLAAVLKADADDLQAALEVIVKRPDADPERAIVVGASAGGTVALALAARNPKNLKGVVSVSGGLRLPECANDDSLVAAYKSFGEVSRVPSIWIYAKNDGAFPPPLVERLQGAYLDGGGDVKLVMFDAFGNDGQLLFAAAAGRMRWLLEADAFLRYHDLPATKRQGVTELLKQLKLEERNRAFLENYLAAPTFKAMARTPDASGHSTQYGASSLELAVKAVLEGCKERHKTAEPCQLIMANDTFVGDKP